MRYFVKGSEKHLSLPFPAVTLKRLNVSCGSGPGWTSLLSPNHSKGLKPTLYANSDFSFFHQEREVENLEGVVANLKQELGIAKKRVSELQHALEDDMHYDSDGLSNDDDGDDDLDLGGLSDDSDELIDNDRPSEPRSYRSYDELEDDDDLSDRLKRKLNDLTESDSLPRSVRRSRPLANSMDSDPSSPRGTYDEEDSRRTGRRSRSGTDDLDTSAEKRQRRSEDRRRKSLEKKRSFEKRSTDNSLH